MSTARGGSRQAELFPRSKKPTITIQDHHPLVWLTDRLDWTELEELVERIRRRKLTSPAGRPPHLRALRIQLNKLVRELARREAVALAGS